MNSEFEQAIEPELPIIDSHHHFIPAANYMLPEYLKDLAAGHNVRATIYVEAGQMYRRHGSDKMKPVGETEFANGMAAMSASGLYGDTAVCAAIIPHAELRYGLDVQELLDAHLRAGGGRVRGIRQRTQWDEGPELYLTSMARPDRGILLDENFRKGFGLLKPAGLSFDAVVVHHQIPELTNLAKAFPETTIILNHMGLPLGIGRFKDRRQDVFAEWGAHLKELARHENVMVKIGGMGMAWWGFDIHGGNASSDVLIGQWKPYVETAIDIFGCDRAMMEGNFPPDGHTCSYVSCWNTLKRATEGYSASERDRLFRLNAARIYDIEVPD
ncbi:amidohydrolase family protein [Sinorhizobium medicae]|uniref:amidohydrolase family protein n=1 Tax=Sinorhizobium medicae TaxID=110321 RepID=UPI0013E3BF1D|nr:amidohydrolase family protein [Sinorhizobium medicae]